jgi:hypothetical protein
MASQNTLLKRNLEKCLQEPEILDKRIQNTTIWCFIIYMVFNFVLLPTSKRHSSGEKAGVTCRYHLIKTSLLTDSPEVVITTTITVTITTVH